MNLSNNMSYEIDATNKALGRIATEAAEVLRGKHLPSYEPNKMAELDVVIKNLSKAKFTGDKFNQKVYHSYSGYHGGIKTRSLSELWTKNPGEVLRRIVYRMLPVNRSRDKVIQHLKFEK